jgi:hypothetical protein
LDNGAKTKMIWIYVLLGACIIGGIVTHINYIMSRRERNKRKDPNSGHGHKDKFIKRANAYE